MMGCIGAPATSRRRPAAGLLSLVPLQLALATGFSGLFSAAAAEPGDSRLARFGVGSATPTSVSLTWTAVGDDGHEGTAACYDLRYALDDITTESWESATQVIGLPDPQPSGSAESFTVTDLTPETTYYFALKVGDEVPNWSALSNVACVTTPSLSDSTALARSDIVVASSILGDYTFTHEINSIREVITEIPSSMSLRRWCSMLEHRWDFTVALGTSAVFHLTAHRPENAEGDNFAFEYSSDGATFTRLVTVASPVPQSYSVPLPAHLSGPILVRVIDTNRVQGRQSLDAVHIDYIGITTTAGSVMHVDNMLVSRRVAGIKHRGVCMVWIYDQAGLPVSGASVTASYSGPLSGSCSGVTGLDGSATVESAKAGPSSQEWCFEITDVVHAVYPYDPSANLVTEACESGWRLLPSSPPTTQLEFGLSGERLIVERGQGHLRFTLLEPAHVELQVFTAGGRRAATLVDGWRSAGVHDADLPGAGLPSGVYFLRLEAGEQREVRRVTVIK